MDKLAQQGIRFTHAYAASGVCTPSRAALLTGCYPVRLGVHESEKGERVFFPRSGPWKLYVQAPARLYDVVEDPGGTRDEAARRPDILKRLEDVAARAREDLGDGDRPGRSRRPPGFAP